MLVVIYTITASRKTQKNKPCQHGSRPTVLRVLNDRTVAICNTNARFLPHLGSTTFGKDLHASTLSDIIPLGCKKSYQIRLALCLAHQIPSTMCPVHMYVLGINTSEAE